VARIKVGAGPILATAKLARPAAPGSSEPRARSRTIRAPETRRAQLLAAASALFVEKGIGSVSVADITTRAGLAKGTFYLYFESRDALLEALRVEVVGKAVEAFGRLEPPTSVDAWPACLGRLVEGALDFFIENRELHDLLSSEPHEHSPERGEWALVMSLYARLEELISAGIEAGALAADIEVAPALVFELLHAAGHLVGEGAPPEKIKAETCRMVKAVLLC
jgi:AcrR family transcriptional regulator